MSGKQRSFNCKTLYYITVPLPTNLYNYILIILHNSYKLISMSIIKCIHYIRYIYTTRVICVKCILHLHNVWFLQFHNVPLTSTKLDSPIFLSIKNKRMFISVKWLHRIAKLTISTLTITLKVSSSEVMINNLIFVEQSFSSK